MNGRPPLEVLLPAMGKPNRPSESSSSSTCSESDVELPIDKGSPNPEGAGHGRVQRVNSGVEYPGIHGQFRSLPCYWTSCAFPSHNAVSSLLCLTTTDVKLGRGGDANSHIGNIKFRGLISEYKPRYIAASRANKPYVAGEVVQIWRNLDPPGRFLVKTDPYLGDDSKWHDVGDKRARKKASQALREKERHEDLPVPSLQMYAHLGSGVPLMQP
jgi:hypothetical protein